MPCGGAASTPPVPPPRRRAPVRASVPGNCFPLGRPRRRPLLESTPVLRPAYRLPDRMCAAVTRPLCVTDRPALCRKCPLDALPCRTSLPCLSSVALPCLSSAPSPRLMPLRARSQHRSRTERQSLPRRHTRPTGPCHQAVKAPAVRMDSLRSPSPRPLAKGRTKVPRRLGLVPKV